MVFEIPTLSQGIVENFEVGLVFFLLDVLLIVLLLPVMLRLIEARKWRPLRHVVAEYFVHTYCAAIEVFHAAFFTVYELEGEPRGQDDIPVHPTLVGQLKWLDRYRKATCFDEAKFKELINFATPAFEPAMADVSVAIPGLANRAMGQLFGYWRSLYDFSEINVVERIRYLPLFSGPRLFEISAGPCYFPKAYKGAPDELEYPVRYEERLKPTSLEMDISSCDYLLGLPAFDTYANIAYFGPGSLDLLATVNAYEASVRLAVRKISISRKQRKVLSAKIAFANKRFAEICDFYLAFRAEVEAKAQELPEDWSFLPPHTIDLAALPVRFSSIAKWVAKRRANFPNARLPYIDDVPF